MVFDNAILAAVVSAIVLTFLVAVRVEGCLCPLSDGENVRLCAMCGTNEAAVKWRRDSPYYTRFKLSYNCSGGTNIASQGDAVVNDCSWDAYPLRNDKEGKLRDGVISIGRELSDGTQCVFKLVSQKILEGKSTIEASCTVGAHCEGECCEPDRVCTAFSNGTGEVEEGYCTECSCAEGYSGEACDDINECDRENDCNENASCTNTEGSYQCICKKGFEGNGFNCSNIDECVVENINCSMNEYCLDTEGSYKCVCSPGFEGDNCTNIDECEMGNHVCKENEQCRDTVGYYSCDCKPGFTGYTNNCEDINECDGDNKCHENGVCENTNGSYVCHCDLGYSGNGYNCTDKNECDENEEVCHENAVCSNTIGSYDCKCLPGFRGDGRYCIGLYECDEEHRCIEDLICREVNGRDECTCDDGYIRNDTTCTDIDECKENASICSEPHTECINTQGNYSCDCINDYSIFYNRCTKETGLVYIVLMTICAVIVVLLILSFIICLWLHRPRPVKFDDLAVKKIDPFYQPKLFEGSLLSFRSEYETLDKLESHCPRCDTVNKMLDNTATEPRIDRSSLTGEEGSTKQEQSSHIAISNQFQKGDTFCQSDICVSHDNTSVLSPYIDEQSSVMFTMTRITSDPEQGDQSNSSESSKECQSVSNNRGESDSCYFSSDVSTNTTSLGSQSDTQHQQSTVTAVSGYIEIGQDVAGFNIQHTVDDMTKISGSYSPPNSSSVNAGISPAEEGEQGYQLYIANNSSYVCDTK